MCSFACWLRSSAMYIFFCFRTSRVKKLQKKIFPLGSANIIHLNFILHQPVSISSTFCKRRERERESSPLATALLGAVRSNRAGWVENAISSQIHYCCKYRGEIFTREKEALLPLLFFYLFLSKQTKKKEKKKKQTKSKIQKYKKKKMFSLKKKTYKTLYMK